MPSRFRWLRYVPATACPPAISIADGRFAISASCSSELRERAPRAEPSSNKFSSCELAQEQVVIGLIDFESLSVSPTKETLLELFEARLTETENSRAL